MRRRISALALTAAMAGGVLLTALPAQAVPVTGVHAMDSGSTQVAIGRLRQQSERLKAEADRLDGAGDHAGADRDRAQAHAIDEKIQALLDAEHNNGPIGGWSSVSG
ncbi:hypothetical protein [Streptomyces sp. CT34]|uniref:hypothetical protein n=1 Tax=Streptomyces sp. CT34 TaxID=1553907 RepID=UPI000ACF3BE8|nr:hypothetical protein [Streptomyces sp. CT34]